MSLEVRQREREGIIILDLTGRLTMGDEDLRFRQQVLAQYDAGRTRLILNLQGAAEIDTTGLGTLIFCALKLRKAGGRMALANLSPSHIELVVLLKLESALEIFSDEQSAVDSFFPDRAIPHYDILSFVKQQKLND